MYCDHETMNDVTSLGISNITRVLLTSVQISVPEQIKERDLHRSTLECHTSHSSLENGGKFMKLWLVVYSFPFVVLYCPEPGSAYLGQETISGLLYLFVVCICFIIMTKIIILIIMMIIIILY